jgi:hypothetical protein
VTLRHLVEHFLCQLGHFAHRKRHYSRQTLSLECGDWKSWTYN